MGLYRGAFRAGAGVQQRGASFLLKTSKWKAFPFLKLQLCGFDENESLYVGDKKKPTFQTDKWNISRGTILFWWIPVTSLARNKGRTDERTISRYFRVFQDGTRDVTRKQKKPRAVPSVRGLSWWFFFLICLLCVSFSPFVGQIMSKIKKFAL